MSDETGASPNAAFRRAIFEDLGAFDAASGAGSEIGSETMLSKLGRKRKHRPEFKAKAALAEFQHEMEGVKVTPGPAYDLLRI